MRQFFHGISSGNFERFINSKGKLSGPWTCSDMDNQSYLWSKDYLIEESGFDKDEFSDNDISSILRMPANSAIVQCAMNGEDSFYILFVEIPDDYNSIENDCSCDNMDGAYCIPENDLIKFTKGYIKCQWNKWNSPFVIKGLLQNHHFNTSIVDSGILAIANEMSDDFSMDSAFEYEMGEYISLI